MKILNKKDFLEILKLVSNVLDSNGIEHEIPYCHIDKETFNYQDIIIEDTTDTNQLIFLLNISNYENDLYSLKGDIENFRFNFIKSPIDIKYNTFHHYGFNFFPYLIKALIKPFNLDYDMYGLHYKINMNKKILVSKNLQDIMEFLNINFKDIYGINIPKKDQLFQSIIESYYFSYESFEKNIMKEIDPNYLYNEKYYKDFLSIAPEYKVDIDNKNLIFILDEYFSCDLIDKISKMKMKDSFPNINKLKEDIKSNIKSEKDIDILNKETEKRKNKILNRTFKMKKDKYVKEGNTYKFIEEKDEKDENKK